MLTLLSPDWRIGFALQRELEEYGVTFETDDRTLPRLQTDSLEEYAIHQAQAGVDAIGSPVFVVIDGLRIDALKGLPGPHQVFAEKLGASALLRLMEGMESRVAHLDRIVVYAEPKQRPVVFKGGTTGVIATEIPRGADPHNLPESLFVPEYRMLREVQTRTLFVLAKEEPALVQHAWGTAVAQFGEWMRGGKSVKPTR